MYPICLIMSNLFLRRSARILQVCYPAAMRLLFFLLCLLMAPPAHAEGDQEQHRLSALVSFTPKSEAYTHWLETLEGYTYMQAWVRFPVLTGDDAIFGIDQEFTEGVKKPKFVSGGDWMAFVGLQRTGTIWVGGGSDQTMAGIPSKERNWKILSLDKPLQPDTWYRIRTVADFANRRYVSFTIEGPDLEKTFDISDTVLDYPNHMPFSGRALTNYTVIMRGQQLMQDTQSHGEAFAFFDDVEAGLTDKNGNDVVLFSDSFEDQPERVPEQAPRYEGETISLSAYKPGTWYLEQEKARCRLMPHSHARTGKKLAFCDGTLQPVDYDSWFIGAGAIKE